MATKKKATKRKPREFTAWAVVKGKFLVQVAEFLAVHRDKGTAILGCLDGEGESVIRVRITEVIK